MDAVGDVTTPDSGASPNFGKKVLFLGLVWSSFNPTSSNPSSVVGGCLSKRRSFTADRGSRGSCAESRLWRPRSRLDPSTGDFAEMSYEYISQNLTQPKWGHARTKERLYESKDSREMENGSSSARLDVVFVEALEGLDRRGQKPFFSGGEG